MIYGLDLILTTAPVPELSGSVGHSTLGQDATRSDFSDQWFTFGDEDGRMLVNMHAEGQGMMFICEGGSGQLTLTHDALTTNQTSITVSSGQHSAVYDLASEGPCADEGERRFMLAAMSLEDPLIQSFREIAKIAVTAGGEDLLSGRFTPHVDDHRSLLHRLRSPPGQALTAPRLVPTPMACRAAAAM